MKASIDIGTNTVLLLVAQKVGKKLDVIEEQHRIPRLGAGVDGQGYLSDDAIDRVIASLNEFKNIIEVKYPEISHDEVIVTGTSAVRDAKNRSVLIDLVKLKTGFDIQVLSGEEEAEYTFWGAQSVLADINSDKSKLVLDIGGGSTEVAYGSNQLEDRYSYDMGCVRFTERFLSEDPPTANQIQRCRNQVKTMLADYEFDLGDESMLLGVAGTVTSLAFICKNMESYDPQALTGYNVSNEQLGENIKTISQHSSKDLADRYPAVMKGRADIFLAGLLILDEFMKKYEFKKLTTSTGGIRHGALLNK